MVELLRNKNVGERIFDLANSKLNISIVICNCVIACLAYQYILIMVVILLFVGGLVLETLLIGD